MRTCHSGTQASASSAKQPGGGSKGSTKGTFAAVSKGAEGEGVGSKRAGSRAEESQLAALQRMNAIIARVARALRNPPEVLDVFAVDEAAGHYYRRQQDFHVPSHGSTHAALALITQIAWIDPPKTVCGSPAQEWDI